MKEQKIIISLPMYNESGSIELLLDRIVDYMEFYEHLYEIVIYNDGSSDDSLAICQTKQQQNPNVKVIDGKVNSGLGKALSELVFNAIDNYKKEDILIIMDADNTHNPEHIHRMLGFIRDGFDVVIASRYKYDSRIVGLTRFRKVLSWGASLMFRMMFPIKGVKDYTCGYRAYNIGTLQKAKEKYKNKLITESGFACMAELLVKLRTLDILACEVPLVLRYDRKVTDSKMQIIKTIRRTLLLFLKKRK